MLLAIGGAHVDRRGYVQGRFVPGASNIGRMVEEVGGGVFNAVRNAVQCGVDAALLSVRGGDAAGEAVAEAIAAANIRDLSAVFLDRSTPSYTALIDADGGVIAGLADMQLYELAFDRQLRRSGARAAVLAAEAILADANLPPEALVRLAGLSRGKPLFAIAISPAKVVRLGGVLGSLDCLFMNIREATSLAGTGGMEVHLIPAALKSRGLRRGVITDGAGPVVGFDAAGDFRIDPPEVAEIADATGAGDALAGTAIAAMMRGRGFRDAVREGIAAAILTVRSRGAVTDLSGDRLAKTEALVPPARPVA
jgi:pseudouridine kinase